MANLEHGRDRKGLGDVGPQAREGVIVEEDIARHLLVDVLDCAREGEAEGVSPLGKGEIDVAQLAGDHILSKKIERRRRRLGFLGERHVAEVQQEAGRRGRAGAGGRRRRWRRLWALASCAAAAGMGLFSCSAIDVHIAATRRVTCRSRRAVGCGHCTTPLLSGQACLALRPRSRRRLGYVNGRIVSRSPYLIRTCEPDLSCSSVRRQPSPLLPLLLLLAVVAYRCSRPASPPLHWMLRYLPLH